jgi:glycosyltransferase involved in cell wall biosynthesis
MSLLKLEKRVRNLVYIDVDNHATYYTRPWSNLVAGLEKASVQLSEGVVSVSQLLATLREQQGARCVKLVPNGVDFPLFYEACHKRTSHPPTLIYVGTLDERWGIDLAIRAIPLLREKIPGIRLLIAGKGPAEQDLKDLSESLNLNGAISFLGLVQHRDLPSVMAEADIGIATSRPDAFRQYASPLKICEYMAAGLPVICSGGGDAEKIIVDSKAGANIKFSPEALAQSVLFLLGSSDRLAAASEAGIEYARSRSWEHQVTQIALFLADVSGCDSSLGVDNETEFKE